MKEKTRLAMQAIADNPNAHPSVREWARNVLAGKHSPIVDPNIVYPGSPSAPGPFPQEDD